METESVSETSDFINLLRLLSAREKFIEFCRRESFKTHNIHVRSLALFISESGAGHRHRHSQTAPLTFNTAARNTVRCYGKGGAICTVILKFLVSVRHVTGLTRSIPSQFT